jgi:hypothetical protein
LVVAASVVGGLWGPAAVAGSAGAAGPVPAGSAPSSPSCIPTGAYRAGATTVVTRDDRPGHTEPQIAVDASDPRRVLGAAEYVLSGAPPSLVLGAFGSADGGHTWRDFGPLPLPPGYSHGDDVSVAFAGTVGLVAAEAYPDAGGSSVILWRTTDTGRHFALPEVVFTAPAGGRNIDHPWLTVTTEQTVVLAWNLHDTLLSARSTDRGATFDTPQVISAAGDVRPNLAVLAPGPRGAVSVMYQAILVGKDTEPVPVTKVVTSVDDGRTFAAPVALPTPPGYAFTPAPFATSLPTLAADPRTGALYIAIAQSPADGAPRDIAIYRSTDHGRSWSTPTAVGAGTPDADRFQPALAVADDGTLYVAYYSYGASRVTRMLAASGDRGAHFAVRQPLSRPFDPACGLTGVWKVSPWIGDYQGLATGGGHVYAAWTDATTSHPQIAVARLTNR